MELSFFEQLRCKQYTVPADRIRKKIEAILDGQGSWILTDSIWCDASSGAWVDTDGVCVDEEEMKVSVGTGFYTPDDFAYIHKSMKGYVVSVAHIPDFKVLMERRPTKDLMASHGC